MKITNASQKPRRYFGLHMTEGVAEYRELGKTPERIFIGENTIKNMDPTFEGCPVYVQHVDSVNLENIQTEADGYVVRSFFNAADGKHWCEFVVVSDKGHEAIAKKWKLSNAYIPKEMVGGGLWHGVEYSKEVKIGEYEHLAIVPNPRYEESVIMSPEEFKAYNGQKEEELKRLTNSKKGEKGMLKFFKREKVENSADLEAMVVTLPKSKVEMSITQLVNEMDEIMENEDEPVMANGEHKVKVGEEEMTVNQLVEKYNGMCAEKKNMGDEEAKKKALDLAAHEDEEMKKNEDEPVEEKKENQEEKEEKKENSHFETLKNAPKAVNGFNRIETSDEKVARGKKKYGSN